MRRWSGDGLVNIFLMNNSSSCSPSSSKTPHHGSDRTCGARELEQWCSVKAKHTAWLIFVNIAAFVKHFFRSVVMSSQFATDGDGTGAS